MPDRWLVGLRVRLGRAALDGRLARGEEPARDALLALRASQLCRLATRERLADGLMSALARAEGVSQSVSAAIPVRRAQVDDARPAVLELAVALRSPEPVCARGVALTRELLVDGNGPLYAPGGPGALYAAACRALLWLRPTPAPPVRRSILVEV